jgi:cell wall-associated NlpC family hydrolase
MQIKSERQVFMSIRTKKIRWIFSVFLGMIVILNGCSTKSTPTPSQNITMQQSQQNVDILLADKVQASKVTVYNDKSGLVWIPLQEAASALSMQLHEENGVYSIGQTDPVFWVSTKTTLARNGDNEVQLPQAPKLIGNKPYITTQSLSQLWGTGVHWVWDGANSRVVITPIDDESKVQRSSELPAQQITSDGLIKGLAAAKSVNKQDIINFAKQYLGTPYQFSAGPYNSTKKFDCSSFMQYIYGNFGIKLPRSSRSQSTVGKTVSISELQPGDLMFFYTPGRYSSNRIIGHVGMYMGNGKIIQTYGKPGVTINNFDTYWRGRFLSGKRLI